MTANIMKFLMMLLLALSVRVVSFQPVPIFQRKPFVTSALFSSVGEGPSDREMEEMDEFLDPKKMEDADKNIQDQEMKSEYRLPISYYSKSKESDDDSQQPEDENIATETNITGPVLAGGRLAAIDFFDPIAEEEFKKNPYLKVVSQLAPSDLISKFTNTAPTNVQSAVRTTILGIIGSLPRRAFETTTVTSGARLASLMFQLQMTGYMFKNAEYRLSLMKSLPEGQNSLLLPGAKDSEPKPTTAQEKLARDPLSGKVRGKLKVKLQSQIITESKDVDKNVTETGEEASDEGGFEVEVDAAAYMSEIRDEVQRLRNELAITQRNTEDAIRKDLLNFIRTLPEKELRSITGNLGEDVLIAMKGLVNVVISGLGEGQVEAETVTEQSGEAMAQLCMWQLVVGYNLRELEVREEMKSKLIATSKVDPLLETSGTLSEPGSFE